MSHSNTCLNCNEPVSKKFCPNCGQKTDTHRITFKHFILHDILHGVWHFEKGILFTLKESLLRPGKAALDYICGKRIKYYNVFYLTLLIIALNLFLSHYYDVFAEKFLGVNEVENSNRNVTGKLLDAFLTENVKLIIFSFIPLFAINSFLIFRKRKLNFSEHFIIAGMIFLGVLTIVTIGSVLSFFDFVKYADIISSLNDYIGPILILLFIIKNYYSTFKESYSFLKISWRLLLFTLLPIIEFVIFIVILMGIFTNWKFGRISY
jgi:hypothetical protein